MSSRAVFLLTVVGVLLSGCAGVPLGEVVEDPARKARLLDTFPDPNVSKVIYHTVLHWPGRELSLVEVVKAEASGSLAVAGLTEMGNTLYTARADRAGDVKILQNNLPLSDGWLTNGPVAELMLPWRRPTADAVLRRAGDGSWRLWQEDPAGDRLYILGPEHAWNEVQLLSGRRLRSRTTLEWDTESVPLRLRTTHHRHHYQALRERASVE
jgi:hypothetical protein